MNLTNKNTFPFHIGQVLFVWECSGWRKAGIQSVCAVPSGDVWRVEITLRYLDGQCENMFLAIECGSTIMRSCRNGKISRWKPGTELLLASNDERRRNPDSFEIELRKETRSLGNVVSLLVSEIDNPRKQAKLGNRNGLEMSSRVLCHLRAKLELLSEKPLSGVERKIDGNVHCLTDSITCAADCSLGEYMSICLLLKDKVPAKGSFHPRIITSETRLSHFGRTSIHFMSVTDICHILGDWNEQRLSKLVLKTRSKRRKPSPSTLRLIGSKYEVENESTRTCYIMIGSCPSEKTNNCVKRLPCLIRPSMEQDENDMSFIHILEKKDICSQHAARLGSLKQTHSSSTSDRTKETPEGFIVRWSCLKGEEKFHFIEDPIYLLQKPGKIELVLPTVTFYGSSYCDEILQHCSESYIVSCLQHIGL